ncbi:MULTISPECIES: hypothetical protein [Bradyrhizobium]|uniref:Uncharacterized protein n=2 Tax=Bradyrhizobium TaxID=374 RepID=A0A809XNE5_9BRAD|nr:MULTISPECIES: hypothetical protein [Bradyrhizobium]AWL91452.1 hypothetical protein CIT37_03615 [Bradyrhizobium ottawaense]AWO88983.1 hypothetical protein DI395_11030 [Bradyrhizobium diazoefficiens]MBP1059280.1 hypothetical protein [Bradyrhizobium japonicum]MBP1089965.1 hypothetical protein [Bradyrhizobium japonicum]MBR1292409.1 hypothetical protein [Bradyrhizobium ottawaense]
MTTFLDDRRLGGAASAILAHKQPNSDSSREARERLAPVIEQHYNLSQRIRLKADGLALWVKAVLSATIGSRGVSRPPRNVARPRDREDLRKKRGGDRGIRESFFVRPRFVSRHFLSAIESLSGALAIRIALPGARLGPHA